ncbi:MAG: response regulator [Rhodobacteraceae bacterium]|nr:response regulator [Paracoccaceae bacterium]
MQASWFKALVVDDEKIVVEEVAEAISLIGGEVDAFTNPVECLGFLENAQKEYDIVIVDLAMPRINGLNFLKVADSLFSNSPRKFIMTGLAEINGKEIESCLMLTVLHKPLSFGDLREKIGHLLHSETQSRCPSKGGVT